MTSVAQLAALLQTLLGATAERLGRSSGCIPRQRRLSR